MISLLNELGYGVFQIPESDDYGGNLVISDGNVEKFVLLKQFNEELPNFAIHEAVDGKEFFETAEVMVITDSLFSDSAIELANDKNVELIDGDGLYELLQTLDEEDGFPEDPEDPEDIDLSDEIGDLIYNPDDEDEEEDDEDDETEYYDEDDYDDGPGSEDLGSDGVGEGIGSVISDILDSML